MRSLFAFLLACGALLGQPNQDRQLIAKDIRSILLFNNSDLAERYADRMPNVVKAINFTVPGNPSALMSELRTRYIGKPLSKETLLNIRKDIILFYESANHPLITIDIPKQDVSYGVLKFVITEGRLGEIVCTGNEWFECSTLKGEIGIRPGQTIDSAILLNDIAWLNRNPFRRIDAVFAPGTAEGTTNIELIVSDRRPLRLYGGMDNTGIESSETGRWFAGFNWGNAFHLDQLLTYQYTSAFDLNRFQSHTVNYVVPLPWRHEIMIYGGYSKTEPHISGFDSEGHSSQVSFRYIAPVGTMYRAWLKEIQFGLDYKNTDNNFGFADVDLPPLITRNVNIFQFMFGVNAGMGEKRHKFGASLQPYWSPGELLSNMTNRDFQDLRFQATSRYFYIRAMTEYTYQIPQSVAFHLQARGQYANQNLLPSEQFALGGYDTVRGYNERQVNVDDAFCFNFELRSPKFKLMSAAWKLKTPDELTLLAFADAAWGTNHRLLPGEDKNQYLIGVGPGLRYAIVPYFTFRLDLGFRLHKTQFGNGPFAKLHVGVMANY